MDTSDGSDAMINNDEMAPEIQVLIPSVPSYSVTPPQIDANRSQSADRSLCNIPENALSLSRSPSTFWNALQPERRRSSSKGRIIFDLIQGKLLNTGKTTANGDVVDEDGFVHILSIATLQFILLNAKDFEMRNHNVIARFGLMHMLATHLCEWLYVLVEETKHEIIHLAENRMSPFAGSALEMFNGSNVAEAIVPLRTRRAIAVEIVVDCRRTNIMGSLVQNASPFLFPCTIEYSLICAVILFEMWKQCCDIGMPKWSSGKRKISSTTQSAHHFSVDCSRAHHGMFAGILVIVLSIISLIMFYVLSKVPLYHTLATLEVTVCELILYVLTSMAVAGAFIRMRDLKFSQLFGGMPLDCTLLLLAQSGVYIYCMFSMIGCYFSIGQDVDAGGVYGLIAETFSIIQTSIQTLFILTAWWRRCRSAQENRKKPGREIITFLLVANMAMWSINALVKNRALFRPTHLQFFGEWSWTIITHVSMPLAIFYRFHSTICLFEIWKTTYKVKSSL